MKKVLKMFLIILICVAVFSGCDNVSSKNGDDAVCKHSLRVASQTSDCLSATVTYVCSKCDAKQVAHGALVLPNHNWSEKTSDGKTTFSCTRCSKSYTLISEIREFSYAQVLERYKIGDPGVKHEGFNNPAVEAEITGAIDAIVRAEFELTVKYNMISVSYDEAFDMWDVTFYTTNMFGGGETVYVNGNGLTCCIVYGE